MDILGRAPQSAHLGPQVPEPRSQCCWVLSRCWPGNGPSACTDGAACGSTSGTGGASLFWRSAPTPILSVTSFYLQVFSCPCRDGAVALLLRVQVGSPTARGHAGTARPRSSHLADAQRHLPCRDDPGPDQQCVPGQALPEPLLREHVWVTQGRGQRKKRDLLLFRDTLVIAKTK